MGHNDHCIHEDDVNKKVTWHTCEKCTGNPGCSISIPEPNLCALCGDKLSRTEQKNGMEICMDCYMAKNE